MKRQYEVAHSEYAADQDPFGAKPFGDVELTAVAGVEVLTRFRCGDEIGGGGVVEDRVDMSIPEFLPEALADPGAALLPLAGSRGVAGVAGDLDVENGERPLSRFLWWRQHTVLHQPTDSTGPGVVRAHTEIGRIV